MPPGNPPVQNRSTTAATWLNLRYSIPSAVNPGTSTYYVERNDPPSPVESFVPGVSKVTRKLFTASPTRYQACVDLLGYPEYFAAAGGHPSYVSRNIPAQYLGIGGISQTSPAYPLLYAHSTPSVEQMRPNQTPPGLLGFKAGTAPSADVARYEVAEITTEFQRRSYAVLPDSAVLGVSQNTVYQLFMGGATGGSYTLTVAGQTYTGSFGDTAATIQGTAIPPTGLQGLSSVGAGNVTVTATVGGGAGNWTITFTGALANTSVVMLGTVSGLTGATGPFFNVVVVGGNFAGLPDESYLQRYVTRSPKPSTRALSLPQGFVRWVPQSPLETMGGFALVAVPILEGVVIPVPEVKVSIVQHEVPLVAIPYAAVQTCYGAVNLATFDPSGFAAPPGVAMLTGFDYTVGEHAVAGNVADLKFDFTFRYNVDSTGVARGWNWGPRAWTDNNGAHFDMRQRAVYDKTGTSQSPNPLIRTADFNALFRPA
jgi:hypothetical protein